MTEELLELIKLYGEATPVDSAYSRELFAKIKRKLGAGGRRRRKKVHINQHNIRRNTKEGTRDPVITVKDGKTNTYGNRVGILDKFGNEVAAVVYQPDNPLSCGAKCWIDTEWGVNITDPITSEEACAVPSLFEQRKARPVPKLTGGLV